MKIERTFLEKDIPVKTFKASSYPAGILQAHNALRSMASASAGRAWFGLSRPENGEGIVYRAGTAEIQEDGVQLRELETLSIRNGEYISIFIEGYADRLEDISSAFSELLSDPGIDPEGYCVEWYSGIDVRCMVRLA
jgi:hypothetical protein